MALEMVGSRGGISGLVVTGFWFFGSPRLFPTGPKSQDRPVTFVVQPPAERAFALVGPMRLSPDGNKLALFTADPSGQAVWLRYLNSPRFNSFPELPRAGTDQRSYPGRPTVVTCCLREQRNSRKRIPRAGFLKLYATFEECPWRLGGPTTRCCFPAHFLAMPGQRR